MLTKRTDEAFFDCRKADRGSCRVDNVSLALAANTQEAMLSESFARGTADRIRAKPRRATVRETDADAGTQCRPVPIP